MSNQKKQGGASKSTTSKSSGGRSGGGSNSPKGSGTKSVGGLLGAVLVVIAAIIFMVTGVDLTGGALSGNGTPAATRVIATSAPATAIPATSAPASTSAPGAVQIINDLPNGFGASKGWWQVYFVKPLASTNTSLMVNGISIPLVNAINSARRTLDIAAFEFNEPSLELAILSAHGRGVQVRIVTDDEHGLEDIEGSISKFVKAGIPVVDDGRSALMHNKIMIIDGLTVWTGATNFTRNGMYRNNNNMVALRSRRAVEYYQAEFNEMFVDKKFGPRSTKGNSGAFVQDGTPVEVWFASEEDTMSVINQKIRAAKRSIHFMAFSFTQDDIGNAMLEMAGMNNVTLQGVFERTGSETDDSEMTAMFCAGFDVRQDSNPSTMHHKVIIIDEQTVITGSFNFSQNAMRSNDENLLIISDADFARQYMEEFQRVYGAGRKPTGLTC